MLQHYIDGSPAKTIESPGKIEEFKIVKINSAAVYRDENTMDLSTCFEAYFVEESIGKYSAGSAKPSESQLKSPNASYELKLAKFRPKDIQIADFKGIVPGCETKQHIDSGESKFTAIAVMDATSRSPPPNKAREFSGEPNVSSSNSRSVREYVAFYNGEPYHNYFYYVESFVGENGKPVDNRYQIEVWPKVTKPTYEQEESSGGRKLLVVFVPFTLAIDIVTSPFQLLFFMINPIH